MWFHLYLQAKKIAPLDFMVYLITKFSIFTSLRGSIYCAWRYKRVRKVMQKCVITTKVLAVGEINFKKIFYFFLRLL
jgi:hypothetical protein